MAERMAHAISLERGIVAGLQPAAPDAEQLAHDVAHHLRALLRDVLCGHLDSDLVAVADGLLEEAVAGEEEEGVAGEPEPQPTEAFSVEAELEAEAEAPPTQLLDLELEPPLQDEEILPFA
jgi:hypothetical protein